MPSSVRSWCWALLLLSGCFKDNYVENSDTTGDGCPEGALGCACYANATCNAGLSCAADVSTCVPEGCTPGELSCNCAADGTCSSPLLCTEGICQSPGAVATDTTPTDTTPADTTDSTTSAPTTSPTTSDPDSTTSIDPTAATATTVGVDCDAGMTCQDCLECADEDIAACGVQYTTCDGIPGCLTVAICLRNCGLTGLCFDACCEGMTQLAIDAAFDLTVCGTDTCLDGCAELEFPSVCPM